MAKQGYGWISFGLFTIECGEFSKLVYYPNWQSPAPNWLTSKNSSISISPNSRFLYLVNENKLWQLDLAASNVSDSKVLIDEYDSTKIIFISDFKESQLAPDGKIYISSYDPVVHNIFNPIYCISRIKKFSTVRDVFRNLNNQILILS